MYPHWLRCAEIIRVPEDCQPRLRALHLAAQITPARPRGVGLLAVADAIGCEEPGRVIRRVIPRAISANA